MTGLLVAVFVVAALAVGRPAEESLRMTRLLRRRATSPGGDPSVARSDGARFHGSSRRRLPGLDTSLLLDLTAAALEAGAAPLAALESAAGAMTGATASAEDEELQRRCALLRLGASWEEAWDGVSPGLEPLRAPLALALQAGAPGAGLLRDAATELRRQRAREAERRAQALGVRLVVPLGACALPAFAAVGVVPVVLSLAREVLAGSS